MPTRRTFLTLLGSLPFSTYGASARTAFGRGQDSLAPATSAEESDVMDEALEMLAPYSPSFSGGLSNHGPMNAEAMISLGRHDAVIGWVERYRGRLEPRMGPQTKIDGANWREALSDDARGGDWDQWFTQELAESPWRDVLGLWVPRLAPGIAAAGLHGVIRVGHAASSLAVKETPQRLDELARALAYWATEYLPLPGEPDGKGTLAPSIALAEVELLPSELRVGQGLITTELKDLRGFEPYAGAINLVDTAAGSPTFISDLLSTFAGTFINTSSSSFEFLHAITGSAAIAELLPYVPAEERATVLACTWQVAAGVFARYGRPGLDAEVEPGTGGEDLERLAERAVGTGDEHTIKLVAACRREWLRHPDPRFLAAAGKRVRRHG